MENASSVPAPPPFIAPPPPVNTLATQSLAGAMTSLDLSGATAALAALPEADSNPSTNTSGISNKSVLDAAEKNVGDAVDDEGKAHLRTHMRTDYPLLNQLFKPPPARERKQRRRFRGTKTLVDSSRRSSTPKAKGKELISPPNEHVHEQSVWEEIAKEDLGKALQRAVQYAIDMHRIDNSRTAQDYYSELVTGVINKGEVEFDAKYLK